VLRLRAGTVHETPARQTTARHCMIPVLHKMTERLGDPPLMLNSAAAGPPPLLRANGPGLRQRMFTFHRLGIQPLCCSGRFAAGPLGGIPSSRQNPKILRIDDAKIVRYAVAIGAPLSGYLLAQKR